jgi:TolB-like protein
MPPGQFDHFLSELKRRRVPRTALWYATAAVAIVQGADLFLPSLGAPAGTTRLLVILAVFGLPIAITFAWVFDISSASADVSRSSRGWVRPIAIAAVCAASGLGAFMMWRRPSIPVVQSRLAADPAHVAVLGFSAIGVQADLNAFAAQLHSRLIDGLSEATPRGAGSKRLRVVSRATILPFMTAGISVDSLRRALDVGTLLDGTVESIGDAVRVTVRLTDTESGDQIASTVAEARIGNRLALLDAVADSVVLIIRKALGPVVRDRVRLAETNSREAFDRVLLASRRLAEFEPAYARKDFGRAQRVLSAVDSLYASAEALDPTWIEPILERGGLASEQLRIAFAQSDSAAIKASLETGLRHAERAIERRPGDYRPYVLRGRLRRLQLTVARPKDPAESARLIENAESDLRTALVGNPNPAQALRLLSELAGDNGHLAEAYNYGEQAYQEDPYLEQVEVTMFRLFEYAFALSRDSTAARWCDSGNKRFSNAIFTDCRLSLAAWSNGYPLTPDSAWALVAAQLQSYQEPLRPRLQPRLHAMVAAVLARNKLNDSALVVLRSAQQRDRSQGVLRAAAGVYGLLGLPDSAIATVRRLLADAPEKKSAMQQSPELRSISSDPRFLQLVRSPN